MGKQRYWLFKTVFTENNQFERIIPATGDVRDKRSVSPLCSTPGNPLPTRIDSTRVSHRVLHAANYFSINWNREKGSILLRNPIPTCSIPFCRCSRTTMTPSKLQVDGTWCGCEPHLMAGMENMEMEIFRFFFFFFFDDRWDCLEEKKNFRVVC